MTSYTEISTVPGTSNSRHAFVTLPTPSAYSSTILFRRADITSWHSHMGQSSFVESPIVSHEVWHIYNATNDTLDDLGSALATALNALPTIGNASYTAASQTVTK